MVQVDFVAVRSSSILTLTLFLNKRVEKFPQSSALANGTACFIKCKQLFEYQLLLLLRDIWW